jgi:hypothetical protein
MLFCSFECTTITKDKTHPKDNIYTNKSKSKRLSIYERLNPKINNFLENENSWILQHERNNISFTYNE